MRYEDLSPEDQKLLNTDLGSFEKEAAAHLELAAEMYDTGFHKLAQETADNLEALYAEKTASAEDAGLAIDAETEKLAEDLGSFIERGFFDGLRKLGQERYGDEAAYLRPFIEEKVAAAGAAYALAKLAKEDPEGHHLRRFLLGNPISSAIEARKGEKTKAFGHALAHGAVETAKGLGKGVAAGGAAGALGGLGAALIKKGPKGKNALLGAGLGAGAGSLAGTIYGSAKGQHGREASKIHGQYSKHKKED
jgi:hypothetical protein